jgi:hypothetical protein
VHRLRGEREHRYRCRAPIRAQMAECLDTGNVRQLHVHQNDVGLVLDRELDSP